MASYQTLANDPQVHLLGVSQVFGVHARGLTEFSGFAHRALAFKPGAPLPEASQTPRLEWITSSAASGTTLCPV